MRVVENGLTVDIYRSLRKTGPFMEYNDHDVEVALANSLYSVVVYDGEKPIGIARLVGDNRITFFLKDVVVHPDYRGQGIGRLIMQYIFEYIDQHASDNAYIGLTSTQGREGFYERFGFIRRPNDQLGAGMSMFYTKDESNLKRKPDLMNFQHRLRESSRPHPRRRY